MAIDAIGIRSAWVEKERKSWVKHGQTMKTTRFSIPFEASSSDLRASELPGASRIFIRKRS